MIGIYESNSNNTNWNANTTNLDNALENASPEAPGSSKSYENEGNKGGEKVQRRLAQNREAARKSRLRKKAYIQQLESSKIKLAQMEQEVQHARQQGVHISGQVGELAGAASSGIAAFEIEHTHWVEEQIKRATELRAALQARVSDIELRMLVEGMISHYDSLFQIKSIIAKSDVFYLMSGKWKTQAERFFLWIGGARPSEILKILTPQLEPLTEKQADDVNNLQQSCILAEDALSEGMDKLLQVVSQTLTSRPLGDNSSGVLSHSEEMVNAMCKLESLVSFVTQADDLRQKTIQQMHKILTVRQAARGLLSLADFFQRLRALSSLWAARPRDPT
ncbi:BZIP family transcription factor [Rhynchospora pubera]|uniref:BZIP family transcription factor n=1 Tax=Rhynchospora pubera TaxID=906938 RepID=A0AAV8D952_9POAL|nr:BZIP family transcription factor [Rhynchospora pubera]